MHRELNMGPRYFALLIIILIMHISAHSKAALPEKQPLVNDESSMIGIELPNWTGFQISFSNQPIELGLIPNKKENSALLIGFPILGHYRGEGYNLRKRLALIQFDPRDLLRNLPEKAEDALIKLLNTDKQHFPKVLNALDIRFNALITGTVQEPAYNSPDNSYNLVYHFWGGLWHKNAQNVVAFYNDNFYMGIFNAHGVKAKDVGFESFTQLLVSWHSPEHMSPDNARIIVEKNYAFSSFWAIAVSSDKKHISVTLFLLANTTDSENFIVRALHESKNLFELKTKIDLLFSQTKHNFSAVDQQIVKNWIDRIFNITGADYEKLLLISQRNTISNLMSLQRELNFLESLKN